MRLDRVPVSRVRVPSLVTRKGAPLTASRRLFVPISRPLPTPSLITCFDIRGATEIPLVCTPLLCAYGDRTQQPYSYYLVRIVITVITTAEKHPTAPTDTAIM